MDPVGQRQRLGLIQVPSPHAPVHTAEMRGKGFIIMCSSCFIDNQLHIQNIVI